jgi:hypothetical protein
VVHQPGLTSGYTRFPLPFHRPVTAGSLFLSYNHIHHPLVSLFNERVVATILVIMKGSTLQPHSCLFLFNCEFGGWKVVFFSGILLAPSSNRAREEKIVEWWSGKGPDNRREPVNGAVNGGLAAR